MHLIEIKETVQIELKTFIKSKYDRDVNINMNDSFIETLGLDSLDIVEIWATMEQKFKIDIPEEEIIKMKNVSDVIEMIQKYLKEKNGNIT